MSKYTKMHDDIDEVFLALVYIDTIEDMQDFANDLFTQKEIHAISQRWKVVRMLHAGISYSAIISSTGMSSTTIARLANALKKRGGGFDRMLEKMDK